MLLGVEFKKIFLALGVSLCFVFGPWSFNSFCLLSQRSECFDIVKQSQFTSQEQQLCSISIEIPYLISSFLSLHCVCADVSSNEFQLSSKCASLTPQLCVSGSTLCGLQSPSLLHLCFSTIPPLSHTAHFTFVFPSSEPL